MRSLVGWPSVLDGSFCILTLCSPPAPMPRRSFYGMKDDILLQGNNDLKYGEFPFDAIGTAEEADPLVLENFLSYDEMAVGSLIGMSTPVHFINNGERFNCGVRAIPPPGKLSYDYEKTGIYIGLVGTRFERPGKMAYKFMMITPEQNTNENGYGVDGTANAYMQHWAEFYALANFPTYEEAKEMHQTDKEGNFVKVGTTHFFFNAEVFRKHCFYLASLFLREADDRARGAGKRAFCHVVGLGLGEWAVKGVEGDQKMIMLKAYFDVMKTLKFKSISAIQFSWFNIESVDILHEGASLTVEDKAELTFDGGLTRVYFNRADPAARLPDDHKDDLLVAMYAWDSGSYPGNGKPLPFPS